MGMDGFLEWDGLGLVGLVAWWDIGMMGCWGNGGKVKGVRGQVLEV